VHHIENECFHAIEGRVRSQSRRRNLFSQTGQQRLRSKIDPQAIHTVDAKRGKLIVVAQPAGHIEAFSVDLFRLVTTGKRDQAAIKAIFLEHDMDMLAPPSC
jgi:hypothetical protein